MKITKLVALFLIIAAAGMVCNPALSETDKSQILRVAIVDDKSSVSISLKGRYKISALSSGKTVLEGPYLIKTVTAANGGIKIGNTSTGARGIRIKTARDGDVYVDSRRFRGDVDVIRKDNGKLLVINNISVEDYLYGVLYHEVSHRWPAECLKAQAIVSRTFALYQARQNKQQPYDLRCDIYSQVYGGKASEKWSTTKAVDSTRGKILTYKGDILPAYFHATCGGHTEDASNLWNIDLAPLKGVECGYCDRSKHYKWINKIPLARVEAKLKEAGYDIGGIVSVSVLSKNASGRADKIEIKDGAGVTVIIAAKDFRQMMGPNDVRSTKFDASVHGAELVLDGFGWGHGVGMCQWGAFGMSEKGKKAEEILKFYYPGTEVTTIDRFALSSRAKLRT